MTRTLTEARMTVLIGSPYSVNWGDIVAVLDELPYFLREIRRINGLTRSALAKEIGVAINTISRFEKGTQVVSFDTAMHIMRWIVQSEGKVRR